MVTKDTIIADALKLDKGVAAILFKAGMPCVGCPSASGESLEQAGMVHGLEVDGLIEEINQHLASLSA